MNYDLKMIKKYYGEDMAHLCRELFPTLLEKEGLLLSLIDSKFAHSKFLYENIIEQDIKEEFKDYIYSLTMPKHVITDTGKSVRELMDEAGYEIFECKSEDDIQSFKKYYAPDEELCTFHGGRLGYCHVFFAVKKNVDEIRRENFLEPKRQDEYGTSVISIQFTRGINNTLSIKNRYNHTVNNPDATFHNNLEKIIPGLTKAFEREYGFKINQNIEGLKLENYVLAEDGKFYFVTHEDENIAYGPDNLIIDKFRVQERFLDKSRYIVLDVLVLDMQEKKLYLYDPTLFETLLDCIREIKKITVTNLKEYKCRQICIVNGKDEESFIFIDEKNRIVGYINNYIRKIYTKFFLFYARNIEYFEAQQLEEVAESFLNGGMHLKTFIAPKLRKVGPGFIGFNKCCEKFYCPSLTTISYNFMGMSMHSGHPLFGTENFVVAPSLNLEMGRVRKKEN